MSNDFYDGHVSLFCWKYMWICFHRYVGGSNSQLNATGMYENEYSKT